MRAGRESRGTDEANRGRLREAGSLRYWLKARASGVGVQPDESGRAPVDLTPFDDAAVAEVLAFHRTLDAYRPTPLVSLPALAREVGVAAVEVKDESHRFGLRAFKALGASYAMSRLRDDGRAGAVVTATDGNHGRAVAWAAHAAGTRAVIYLPASGSEARARAMRELGAEVRRVDGSYDEAVAAAEAAARDGELRLVQDMAWPGYETVPGWIMQGYTTLIEEALEQADAPPTHLLLPCGVGSFAAAIIGRLVRRTEGRAPFSILIEPLEAACAIEAFVRDADEPPLLAGDTHTFMAGLSCGRLSHGAWPILREHADAVVAIPESVAAAGMRRLASGEGNDPVVESGESGAVGVGLLSAIVAGEAPGLAEALGLDSGSRLLAVSTEGATDPEIYRRVVGDGLPDSPASWRPNRSRLRGGP